jgi:PAS domain S-box-containing protein
MVGITEDAVARMNIPEFHPEWAAYRILHEGIPAAIREGVWQGETALLSRDGREIPISQVIIAHRNGHGEVDYLSTVARDITERKLAEDAQRRFTAILEATPDFVGIADAQGRALYLNRGGRAMMGIGDDDVTRMRIPDFHPAWAAEKVLGEGLPEAIQGGYWSGETALLGRDGQEIPVSQVLMAHRGPGGKLEYVSTVMRDITERKRNEEAQRFLVEAGRAFATSFELDAVIESITQSIVPRVADFCVLHLMTEGGHIDRVAVAHAQAAQKPVLEKLRELHRAEPDEPMVREALRSREPQLVTDVTPEWLETMAASPEQHDVLKRLAPRSMMIIPLVARGRVVGAICAAWVQPGRRYAPEDLGVAQELALLAGLALENARLFDEAREATRVRDEVLRVVAHDLRNPLNTVLLTAGLLKELMPGRERKDEREKLVLIESAVARANRLIQDLLDVVRQEAGPLELDRQPVDAAALAAETVQLHRVLADERSIHLETDIAEALDPVYADRDRVLQLFSNLIGNALKFTPPGGTVTVHAAQPEGAAEVRFAVADTGPGIREEDRSRLFDPFWQASKGTGGAGLGLAISKRIAEAHDGRIWVESEVGMGSTFYFTIPVARTEPTAPLERKARPVWRRRSDGKRRHREDTAARDG